MKKRFIILITVAIMLLVSSVFAFVGCDSDEKLEYSVTVLSADAQPVEGATVSWQQSGKTQGSAVTDAEGFAKVSIPAGTYNVVLSNIGEGMTYTDISVTPSMREITLALEVKSVTYTATVVDKSGAAAKGVTVTWSNGSTVAGTAVTGDDGSASCELDYGDYSVTVSNLPDGNIFTDAIDVSGKSSSARFELRGGETVSYTVTVKSAGGLKFKDMTVFVYSGNKPIHSGKTDNDGVLSFSQPAGEYTVDVPTYPEGYTVTKKAKLTAAARQGEIVLTSEVILEPAEADQTYVIGDIIHDYTFTTPYEVDGAKKEYSIAEILETKQAVVINNWGTKCSWCVKEMPAMEEMYNAPISKEESNSPKFKDKIELLAISNYQGGDSDATIVSYRQSNNYTFPMMRDNNSFAGRFDITSFPTTIIIDRYGAVAHIESGAVIESEVWERLINKFIGDDYVQTFTPGDKVSDSINSEMSKPDITVSADHYQKIATAINNFTPSDTTDIVWSGETENEYIWPFILKTEEGVSQDKEVLCSSNSTKPNSMSALYGNVKMPVGKVLTFDYYSECETDSDILYVVWDGKIIKQISGLSDGWQTCYLYTELTAGEHRLALTYRKDNTKDVGKDNVYIRNVRFEDISAMVGSMDMMRAAAYGVPEANATTFPHYAEVEIASDGYYHVKRDKLENKQYAGNDPSPMLFANMTGVTNWNNLLSISSLVYATDESGEYIIDCRLNIDGKTRDYRPDIIEFCRIASASDIEGFLPVDKELHDILVAFMTKVMGDSYHANAWLELCYFYSHYGDGEFVGNPIIGLTTKTAITAEVDATITADVTRNMAPFPSAIYAFTPTESAVYRIQSLLPDSSDQATQIWLYDDSTDVEHPLVYSGDDRFFRDGINEHNFTVYRYLTAGHKYYLEVALLMAETGTFNFKITNVGQSKSELVACSANVYELVFDPTGEKVLGIILSGAVEYDKDNDGYYHVKNADGSLGDFIYFDVKYPTTYTTRSITALVDEKLRVPEIGTELDYYTFDFKYRIAYSTVTGDDGEIYTGYDPKFVFADHPVQGRDSADFTDYTDKIKEYIAKAEKTGENAGLVKVDDELVKILKLFIEVRINMLNITEKGIEYEEALENEWLRFCWYYTTHDANNP